MSAYPEDADHFARWLDGRDGDVDPCAYVPRGRYGDYLAHVLDKAQRRTPWATVQHLRDRVVDLDDESDVACTWPPARSSRSMRSCSPSDTSVSSCPGCRSRCGDRRGWSRTRSRRQARWCRHRRRRPGRRHRADDGRCRPGARRAGPGRCTRRSRMESCRGAHVAGQLPAMEAPELSSSTPDARPSCQAVMAPAPRPGDRRVTATGDPAVDSLRAIDAAILGRLSGPTGPSSSRSTPGGGTPSGIGSRRRARTRSNTCPVAQDRLVCKPLGCSPPSRRRTASR